MHVYAMCNGIVTVQRMSVEDALNLVFFGTFLFSYPILYVYPEAYSSHSLDKSMNAGICQDKSRLDL